MNKEQEFLSTIQMYSAYSRFIDEKKESFDDIVNRVLYSQNGLFNLGDFTDQEKSLVEHHLRKKIAFGSARYLWIGGTEWLGRDNSNHFAPFNCISMNMDSVDVFGYAMNLGMQGCGVGQVIEPKYIEKLPIVRTKINLILNGKPGDKLFGERTQTTIVKHTGGSKGSKEFFVIVGDSRKGWVDAYQILINISYGFLSFEEEVIVYLDLSNIRPYGEKLQGFGGVANPNYIGIFFDSVVNIFNQSVGRQLNSLEVMLVLEEAAKNTVSGNIRRVAGMKQGSPIDQNFVTAKENLWQVNNDGKWFIDPVRDSLRMSNHTSVYHSIPSYEIIKESVTKQFFTGEGAIQYAPEAIARANADLLNTTYKKQLFISKYLQDQKDAKNFLQVLGKSQYQSISEDELNHRIKRYGLNPCVTADTWVFTYDGAKQVKDMICSPQSVYIHGTAFKTNSKGFYCTGKKDVFLLETNEGYSLTLTENHQLLKNTSDGHEWVALSDLKVGDRLSIHNHFGVKNWKGKGESEKLGYDFGINGILPKEDESYDFYVGYFKYLLSEMYVKKVADNFILSYFDWDKYHLQVIQRMLLRLGVFSTMSECTSGNNNAGYSLCIDNAGIYQLLTITGKSHDHIEINLDQEFPPQIFTVTIKSITPQGVQTVYDCTVPEISCFDANGFVAHNCAEVIGSDFRCNLGTVHLSQVGLSINDQVDAFRAATLQVVPLLKLDVDIPRFQLSHKYDPIVLVSATQVNQWFINYFGPDWINWWLDGRPESNLGLMFKREETKILGRWRNVVEATVADYCDRHNLKIPNRCTGFKPEGSLSWLSGSPGFSGIHFPPSGSLIYIRRKTFLRDDPIALAAMDYGYQVIPSADCKDENGHLLDDPFDPRVTSWLLEIPVRESVLDSHPALANVDFNQIPAIAQFDWVMQMQRHYSGHNTSCTISFTQDEIEPLSKAIHTAIVNNSGYVSMALLARMTSNQTFPRLPFESISESQYYQLMTEIESRRKSDNFEEILKQKLTTSLDLTTGEVACSSEICEVAPTLKPDFDKLFNS